MEFAEVVARRHMVRRFLDRPVDEGFLRRALTHATRAPSAGFTQGWSFLVLRTPEDVSLFWASTTPGGLGDLATPPPAALDHRPNPGGRVPGEAGCNETTPPTNPGGRVPGEAGCNETTPPSPGGRVPGEAGRNEATQPTNPNPWLDGMRTAPAIIVVLASEPAYRSRYSEADKTGAATRAAEMPWWQIDAAMASLLILQTATDEGLGACFFGVPAAGVAGLRDAFGVPEAFAPIGAIALGHPTPNDRPGSPSRRPRRPLDEVAHDGSWGVPLP